MQVLDLNSIQSFNTKKLPDSKLDTLTTFNYSNYDGVLLMGNLADLDRTSSVYITEEEIFPVNQTDLFQKFGKSLPNSIQGAERFPRRPSILQNPTNKTEYILYGGEHLAFPGSELFLKDIFKSPLDTRNILFNNNVMRFNLERFTWENDLNEGPSIIDSSNFILNDILYLIGGFDLKSNIYITLSNVTFYDLRTREWGYFNLDSNDNTTRIGHRVALNGSKAFISGGHKNYSSISQSYFLSPEINSNPILVMDILERKWIQNPSNSSMGYLFGCSHIYEDNLYYFPPFGPSNETKGAITINNINNWTHREIKFPIRSPSSLGTTTDSFNYYTAYNLAEVFLTCLNFLFIFVCFIIFILKYRKETRWTKNNEFLVTKDLKPLWSDPPPFSESEPKIELSSLQAFDFENDNPYIKVLLPSSSNLNPSFFEFHTSNSNHLKNETSTQNDYLTNSITKVGSSTQIKNESKDDTPFH